MCGIAGYFAHRAKANPPGAAIVTAMRDHMIARGPDGAGLWESEDKRLCFGHRRLTIIDLSEAGAQPMRSADGRLTLTYNGEIYNYQALRTALEAKGRRFASHSDTEVLLHLYAEYGLAMFDHLRGMYAFALWDADRRQLLLGRDPYGIKPLYYADDQGCVRFASQVKALLRDPALPRDPDPAGLTGFHLLGSVPEPFTLYRAIRACPAGSYVLVDETGVRDPVRHSDIAGAIASADPRMTERDAQAAMLECVRAHLVADVEVGAFLSGGVDSGALIGLMRDAGQDNIRAVTLGFDELAGTAEDELPLAAEIARLYGVEQHVRTVGAAEFEADLPAIFAAMDQPSIDGINSWFVSKATRELGLKVALSGIGGDELLAGYSTFRTIPRARRLAGPIAAMPIAGPAARRLLHWLAPALIRNNPKLAGLFDLSGSWAGAYLLRRALLLPFELDGVMDPATAREGLERLRPLELIGATIAPDPGSDTGRVAALESSLYLRNQLLRDADWAGMAHSLEIRVPLVDYTLLGQIAGLIGALPVGQGKRLLADAPSRPLPGAIVNKPKTGFAIPVASWRAGRPRYVPDRRDSRVWARHVLDQAMTPLR